jgi:hypothetical protein
LETIYPRRRGPDPTFVSQLTKPGSGRLLLERRLIEGVVVLIRAFLIV